MLSGSKKARIKKSSKYFGSSSARARRKQARKLDESFSSFFIKNISDLNLIFNIKIMTVFSHWDEVQHELGVIQEAEVRHGLGHGVGHLLVIGH